MTASDEIKIKWRDENMSVCLTSQSVLDIFSRNDMARCRCFPGGLLRRIRVFFFLLFLYFLWLVLSFKHLINQFYPSGWVYQSQAAVLNKE